MKLLVCGGCGFIGSAFIRNHLTQKPQDKIINLDSLTIGSNKDNLKQFEKNENLISQGMIKEMSPKKAAISTNFNLTHRIFPFHINGGGLRGGKGSVGGLYQGSNTEIISTTCDT